MSDKKQKKTQLIILFTYIYVSCLFIFFPGANVSATSSAAGSDFGADDEVTSAAVGFILDSLDDIHCLLEAKNKDEDFLAPILEDHALMSLLNLYDQISTNSHRPFRHPPSGM